MLSNTNVMKVFILDKPKKFQDVDLFIDEVIINIRSFKI